MSSFRPALFFTLTLLVTYGNTPASDLLPQTLAPAPESSTAEAAPRRHSISARPGQAFRSDDADCSGLKPRQIGSDVPAPAPLKRVAPVFKDVARHMSFEGALILQVIVNKNGKVCKVKVIQPLHRLVDEPVIEALRQWTFEPTLRKGKPVSVAFPMSIRFGSGE